MRRIHFDEKPAELTEDQFSAHILAGVSDRIVGATRIVRSAEYYYSEKRNDFASEEDDGNTGRRKLVIIYDVDNGSEAEFHEPVQDMINELLWAMW